MREDNMPKSTALQVNQATRSAAVLGSLALAGLAVWGCSRDESRLTAPRNRTPSFSTIGGQQSNLDSALAVHRRHTMALIAIPGVVGTAVGVTIDGRPAIRIFTKTAGVGGLPDAIEGIPVEVRVTGEIFARSCDESTCRNTDVWPVPVPNGVSTGNVGQCESGTIGARVRSGSAVYALSNNHVYALENTAPLNSNVLQPGTADGQPQCSSNGITTIGTLSAFAPIQFCGSSCPSNTIDAAIAISDVARLDNATPPTAYWWPNSVVRTATVGLGVKKYGRTTSLTVGQVTGIDATVTVSYLTGNALFVHQIVIGSCSTACARPGDSGSLWVTSDASVNPVGLLFAGNGDGSVTWANQIGNVLAYFGVTIDNTAHPTASGGLAAWCDVVCSADGWPTITAVTAAGGQTITVTDNSGHTGTITLSGATASGGLTAWCDAVCGGDGWPEIVSVTAAGGHTITVTDNSGHTGTITLSGASASGGLTAWCDAVCGGDGFPIITAVTATGSDGFFLSDNNSGGASQTGYLKLSF